jgi:hypothetical protein
MWAKSFGELGLARRLTDKARFRKVDSYCLPTKRVGYVLVS